jgi:RNA-directed DNA polymerase
MWMKLAEIQQRLRRRTNDRLDEIGRWLRSVVCGWLQYFAVPGTSKALNQFVIEVVRLWARTIRRRSQRGRRSWPWTRINKLVQHWIPPPKIIHPHPDQRLCVK